MRNLFFANHNTNNMMYSNGHKRSYFQVMMGKRRRRDVALGYAFPTIKKRRTRSFPPLEMKFLDTERVAEALSLSWASADPDTVECLNAMKEIVCA